MVSADYTHLSSVSVPSDLRRVSESDLSSVCAEVRSELIDAVSVTGGHLGAGLGVVELTVALHHVFDTPNDRLIWDVGHQAYPHKILTGRRDRIRTLRQAGGLSGFTKRTESVYDPFGAAHSSTSISAGLGMAVAHDLDVEAAKAAGQPAPKRRNVIAVIGDGAMSAGMAYEAMNNAGAMHSRLIVILNDNDMSIAPPVGAMSAYLARLTSGGAYRSLRETAKQVGKMLPKALYARAAQVEEYARGLLTGGSGTLFEELGFYYVGPIDGHNLDHLLPVLKNVREAEEGPVLVHVVTQKGKGYGPAEAAADRGHAVVKFDVVSGVQAKAKANAPAYTRVFGESLVRAADADPKVVAVTAAMPSGTGIDLFGRAHPTKTFDVGIAEQHAVTFAAGLATEGYKPFVAIYSTFLQRAYDQVVHDVALQNLPVRFCLDRAGLVGADGATHAGAFDLAYLCCLPNMTVMAAADEAELVHMVATCASHDAGPIALRYPRGEGVGIELPERGEVLAIGKGRIVKDAGPGHAGQGHGQGTGQGTGRGGAPHLGPRSVALLSLGTRLAEAVRAAEVLEAQGYRVSVADARFAKPLDEALVLDLASRHAGLVTLEEGSRGGFGAHVLHLLSERGALDAGTVKVRTLTLPDTYQDQDTPDAMYREAGLDADSIAHTVQAMMSAPGTARGQGQTTPHAHDTHSNDTHSNVLPARKMR